MNKALLDILPKKKQLEGIGEYITGKEVGRNEMLDEVITALEKAGVGIVPSEEKIEYAIAKTLSPSNVGCGESEILRRKAVAKAIRKLMIKGEEKG